MAALYRRLNIVQYLILEQKCDPVCTDEFKDTPLHAAASNNQLEIVKYFIEILNIPPDIEGQLSITPLALAYSQCHYRVVHYLESINAELMSEHTRFVYSL